MTTKIVMLMLATLAPAWPVMTALSDRVVLDPKSEAQPLDKTWTKGGQKKPAARKSRSPRHLRARGLWERRGGDSNPWSRFTPLTGLANRRFRPLSHLSKSLAN
jgi:hypothetical protein